MSSAAKNLANFEHQEASAAVRRETVAHFLSGHALKTHLEEATDAVEYVPRL